MSAHDSSEITLTVTDMAGNEKCMHDLLPSMRFESFLLRITEEFGAEPMTRVRLAHGELSLGVEDAERTLAELGFSQGANLTLVRESVEPRELEERRLEVLKRLFQAAYDNDEALVEVAAEAARITGASESEISRIRSDGTCRGHLDSMSCME
eukprot:CAMPEP_0171104964 /NCGR_PEP_ID=MMETSP0766_2-20121228/61681_1 /TAXON_ID=439317 /ORGANISM="Gambierdiscus australes, Strain CAWD 149" /LENGTH=152 /DNA_ID=CAMNT_0011565687 /DNA_START=18 /DNA_END=476 /DNA_ORIENTATION=+